MKLAFVIPAYNEEALIGKCVESVLAEVKRSGRDCDVVVVNNNSTDRTREIAASFAGARVVDEMQKGLVSARDGGFRATTAELVANIDGDTMVTPGWLDVVFDEFEKDPKLVCLSGPYVYYDLNPWQRFLVGGFYGLTTLIYWINRYVLANPAFADDKARAKRPLAAAEVQVDSVEGRPGYYAARFYLRPHYQLEGINASLRLVSELPSLKQ